MDLWCPSRGCRLCGVDVIQVAAIEVVRWGGPEAAAIVAWRSVTTTASALGGRGPQGVRGHLCPQCSEAVRSEGAVGPSSRGRALVEYVRRSKGDPKATRLRLLSGDDFPPLIPGWGALPPTT